MTEKLAESAQNLRKEIHKAIEKYGHTKTEEFGEVYAYETDGYGMYHLMDDANVPSLLSIKYLGYPTDRELAENTRNMILSEANPYYYKGKAAERNRKSSYTGKLYLAYWDGYGRIDI